jgi:hypothetical protein
MPVFHVASIKCLFLHEFWDDRSCMNMIGKHFAGSYV